jgi:hypothetical protein
MDEIIKRLRTEARLHGMDSLSFEISTVVRERAEELTPEQIKTFFEIVDEAKSRVKKRLEEVYA